MLLLKTEMRMEPRELINFMAIAERLKCNTRHSWTSTYRHESVAEHSWRLTLLAYFVQDEFPEADMNKVIQMCILHDLGEAITGDIPAFYKTQKDEEVEDRKIEELFQTLPPFYRDKLLPLFREMGELATLEAKIYKALDKMEAIFQHNEADISTWIPLEYTTNLEYGAENVAFSPYLRRLKQELYNDSVRKIESVSEQGGGSNNRWVDLTLKVSPKMIKDAQGNENKAFTAFAVNCVIPARNGIDKTVEISVAKDGEEHNRADYTVGKRVEISGVLTFKKRGDNLYFNMSASSVNLTVASNEDSIKGEMLFRGKTGKNIEEKTDKKGKNFLQFSAFSAEKVNDGFEYLWVRFLGFDREREEWLQPQTGIEAKGELELSVYNDKLNIACKVSEMSEYVKQPYNPNN